MTDVLQAGQIFAQRYRIERFLAKGGFGAVYVAEQLETELRVAIKVLWPHVLHSGEAVEKFKLEARVAGRVGSEHIVKVFDAGFDEGTKMPFLVMELLEGAELEDLVARSGPLSADQVVVYFRQIASALDRAHGYTDRDGASRPIVHRDLKPENLFLARRESGEPLVKILDFGIAKVLGDSSKVSQEVKGTPLYMAYEQAAGGPITPQTDIWALGLIAFYLLTGRPYWKAAWLPEASVTQLFGEVLSLPIDPPSQRAAAIGAPVVLRPSFDAWFARCVDRDPSHRFASAGECATALANALSAPETLPGPGTPLADVFGSTGIAPSGPGIPSSVVAPAPQITTGALLTMGHTRPSLDVERPKRRALPLVLAVAAVVAIGAGIAVMSLRRQPTVEAVPLQPAALPAPVAASPPPPSTAVTNDSNPLPAAAPNPGPVSPVVLAAQPASPASPASPAGVAPRVTTKGHPKPSPTLTTPLATSHVGVAKLKPSDLYSDR